MEKTQTTYAPGACNIGPAERRSRLLSGWVGLAITVVAWVLLAAFNVAAPWRILLFLPAATGAAGFLQAAMHFCAAFGMRGVFNFGDQVGKTQAVEQSEFRAKDRRKALQIGAYSVLIGAAVALAAFFAG